MTWPRFGITNVFVLLSLSCHADSSVSPSCPSRTSDTRYLMISEIQCPLASSPLSAPFSEAVLPSKASAKIQPFSKLPKIFSHYFSRPPSSLLSFSSLQTKKFFKNLEFGRFRSGFLSKSTAFFTKLGLFSSTFYTIFAHLIVFLQYTLFLSYFTFPLYYIV